MSQRSDKRARRFERSSQGRAVARIQEHTRAAERSHPGCWGRIDSLRENGERWWPEWCWAPLAVCGVAVGRMERDPAAMRVIGLLAALATWRQARGVYLIDATLAEALASSELDERIPADPLYRLPEWCVHLAAPDGLTPELVGVFAHLNHDAMNGRPELRLFLDDAAIGPSCLALALDAPSVAAALDDAVATVERRGAVLPAGMGRREAVDLLGRPVRAALAAVLYLCSSEPDLVGPVAAPAAAPRPGGTPAPASYGSSAGGWARASAERARRRASRAMARPGARRARTCAGVTFSATGPAPAPIRPGASWCCAGWPRRWWAPSAPRTSWRP